MSAPWPVLIFPALASGLSHPHQPNAERRIVFALYTSELSRSQRWSAGLGVGDMFFIRLYPVILGENLAGAFSSPSFVYCSYVIPPLFHTHTSTHTIRTPTITPPSGVRHKRLADLHHDGGHVVFFRVLYLLILSNCSLDVPLRLNPPSLAT
ncbi:hypothetical protein B0H13DRAFT_2311582 [Mycena leptocephala]|nr:hypothetical protein B0H13DRAFT_2311582 [Mycena leptocephala]